MDIRVRKAIAMTMAMCVAVVAVMSLSGCSLLFGTRQSEPTSIPERAIVPTFTPTPEGQQAAPAETAAVEAPAQAAEATSVPPQPVETPAPAEETPTEEPVAEPPTPTPAPKLIVNIASANARNGPGTEYGLAGAINQGQAFDITGRNAEGTWWQFCCVNGQQAWIFGELVSTENADIDRVALAENIPAPPVVAQQPPVVAQPEPPQPEQPQPEQPQPEQPAPPPASDPCASIGGDGCKFKVRNGPLFGNNGGAEIKLQLLFVHSGVDGGQPQGSYFVAMTKDGAKLPISDGTRSIALEKSQGPLGAYNYEYKIGLGDIPGNTVAGTYVMFVLDGNGERDSQDFVFNIPEGQGEVWLEWDQG